MNPTILNREFQHPADGWYQIESLGEHPNRAAGVVQVIDGEAVESIVNRFNADAAAGALRHGREMLIDHEHFSDQPDQETRAYGWLQELQNRDGVPYGRIRWTATGKAAVDGGDYRFFSTEYDPKDLKVLNSGKTARVRPTRLAGLTLTNMPNNRGQKPITNRAEPGGPADSQPPTQRTNTMKNIATKLGLSAEASEDAILAEVTKLLNRATTAEGQLAPVTQERDALRTENKTLLETQVDADLAPLKNRISEEKLTGFRAELLKNRAAALPFVQTLVEELGKDDKATKPAGKVLNRADAKAPAPKGASTAQPVTTAQLNAEVRKVMNRDGSKFEAAYNTLRQERPELFAE